MPSASVATMTPLATGVRESARSACLASPAAPLAPSLRSRDRRPRVELPRSLRVSESRRRCPQTRLAHGAATSVRGGGAPGSSRRPSTRPMRDRSRAQAARTRVFQSPITTSTGCEASRPKAQGPRKTRPLEDSRLRGSYSRRNAFTGSTRLARTAGISVPTSATKTRIANDADQTSGSDNGVS